MNKNIKIYKIEFIKTNVVLSKTITYKKVFFDNKKEFDKFWRLHLKRLNTTNTKMCGCELIAEKNKLNWKEIIQYPEIKNTDNAKEKKKKSVYSFDFQSVDETKEIIDKLFNKNKDEEDIRNKFR